MVWLCEQTGECSELRFVVGQEMLATVVGWLLPFTPALDESYISKANKTRRLKLGFNSSAYSSLLSCTH
jgi:hypothetical protein